VRVMFCLVLVLCAPIAAGCGSDADGDGYSEPAQMAPVVGQGLPPEIQHPVTEAIDRIQHAFEERDYKTLCALVTPRAARDAGEAAHGDATTCRRDVYRLFDLIHEGGGWRHAGAPRVTAVTEDGDRATAVVALDRRWQAQVELARRDGRWQLDGLFGTSLQRAVAVAAGVPDSTFPTEQGKPLAVANGDNAPCPDLSDANYPTISGGCRLRVTGKVAPLTMLTPFGDFRFDRCSIAYTIRVDSSGRTWTEDFDVVGEVESACGDVSACYDPKVNGGVPWRGRIHRERDDSYVHQMDACVRTCVGNFVGALNMQLEDGDDGWRATPIDGGGNSGFRFDNPLSVRGELELGEPG